MSSRIKGIIDAVSDLAMDYSSRMARAKDQGFDTDTPVYHGTASDFDAFDPDRAIGSQFWSTTDRAAIESGDVGAQGKGVVKEMYQRINNPAGWNEYDKFGIDELIGQGYDGLKLPDTDGQSTMVAFNPNQYRSVNAAFNPAKKDSSNLLAGVTGAGLLGGSMVASEDADAGVIARLSRLGFYTSQKELGGVVLYRKDGTKVGDFEYVDDAVDAAHKESGLVPESGSFIDAQVRMADDTGLPSTDYRGGHTAPTDAEYHGPLHAMDETYPEDIYSPQGPRYYGHGDDSLDNESFSVIQRMRGKPDNYVDMYRSVPLDAPNQIIPGDWVTLSKKYAQNHGEGIDGGYKVLQGQTQAKRLRTDGNSPHEFGYTGSANPGLLAATALGTGAAASPKAKGLMGMIGDTTLETMSGVNRAMADGVNFLTSDQINAILNLSGSDKRIPDLYDIPGVESGTKGNYMEPGLLRQIVRQGSEFLSPI